MPREHWTESDDPRRVQRGLAGSLLLWGLGALVVISLVGLVAWVIGVMTSDVHGRGEAIKKKNDAVNRITAQENFEQLYADVKSSDQRLDQAAADKREHPGDPTYATNYTGLRNHCLELVGDYNASARKFTQQDFRSADLPYQLDDADPATDCKESART